MNYILRAVSINLAAIQVCKVPSSSFHISKKATMQYEPKENSNSLRNLKLPHSLPARVGSIISRGPNVIISRIHGECPTILQPLARYVRASITIRWQLGRNLLKQMLWKQSSQAFLVLVA
ncbi:hypothetical protein V6N12_049043 [Hibiscus sabdariffa]|uniref:Uncharacterized protein n=1 Tax=Hibiscus sabdariffa TaxID=183260 RepID=A0ABR2EJ15_9ROSI